MRQHAAVMSHSCRTKKLDLENWAGIAEHASPAGCVANPFGDPNHVVTQFEIGLTGYNDFDGSDYHDIIKEYAVVVKYAKIVADYCGSWRGVTLSGVAQRLLLRRDHWQTCTSWIILGEAQHEFAKVEEIIPSLLLGPVWAESCTDPEQYVPKGKVCWKRKKVRTRYNPDWQVLFDPTVEGDCLYDAITKGAGLDLRPGQSRELCSQLLDKSRRMKSF